MNKFSENVYIFSDPKIAVKLLHEVNWPCNIASLAVQLNNKFALNSLANRPNYIKIPGNQWRKYTPADCIHLILAWHCTLQTKHTSFMESPPVEFLDRFSTTLILDPGSKQHHPDLRSCSDKKKKNVNNFFYYSLFSLLGKWWKG